MKHTSEEIFLIELLFTKKRFEDYTISKLNLDLLIKITSHHLLIPALYVNLKIKNYLDKFPEEFTKYIREIYVINKNRNIKLLEEIKEISIFFNLNKIDHVFLKGAGMLAGNFYKDIGERMIGDIDLLIEQKKISESIILLNKKKYFNKYVYLKWEANVLPNFINNNKLFAIDLHTKLFPKKHNKLMSSKNSINNCIKTNRNIKILNHIDNIKYSILNYQISDYGYLRNTYSLRKLYDVLMTNHNVDYNQLLGNKFTDSFFLISNNLNITSVDLKSNTSLFLNNIRFKIKNRIRILRFLDRIGAELLVFLDTAPNKIIEMIYNKKYRKSAIKKMRESTKIFS